MKNIVYYSKALKDIQPASKVVSPDELFCIHAMLTNSKDGKYENEFYIYSFSSDKK